MVAIVLAVAFFFIAPVLVGAVLSATGAVFTPLVTQAIIGATAGFLSGAANAALAGGDLGDVLRGGLVGAVQGAISSGPLHSMEGATSYAGKAAHVIGHGATGGAANVAMGGKFQDGFLSAAAGAAATHTGLYGKFQGSGIDKVAGRTAVAAVIGGTASALGGGKFANGAWTAAFQHLLNSEAVAKAESSFEIERAIPVETDDPMFDERTNKMLNSLHPEVKRLAHRHIYQLKRLGIDARIISGNRTYKEQDYIYAQGRTRPGKIVTNARGGYSNHNFGIAYDIGIFGNGGKVYLTADSVYKTPGIIGEKIGLEWGGRWKSTYDPPHFQYRTGLNVRQLRELVAAGKPIIPD